MQGCSFWADNFNGIGVHLNHRDVSLLAISRAPLSKLEAYKKRMGWSFKWVSSFGADFNYDYNVSSMPEEVANGNAFDSEVVVSACSTKTRTGICFTPIHVIRAALTC